MGKEGEFSPELAEQAQTTTETPPVAEFQAEISRDWHGCHELFIPTEPTHTAPPNVEFLTFHRNSSRGTESGGKIYRACDFPNLAAVAETFGGGEYIIRAVSSDPGKRGTIIAQRRHEIDEEDFPPVGFIQPRESTRKRGAKGGAAPVAATAPATSHGPPGLLDMVTMMREQEAAYQRRMEEERKQREEDRRETRALVSSLVAPVLTAVAGLATAWINKAANPPPPPPPPVTDSKEVFLEGMAFHAEMQKANGASEKSDDSELLETIKVVAGAVQATAAAKAAG